MARPHRRTLGCVASHLSLLDGTAAQPIVRDVTDNCHDHLRLDERNLSSAVDVLERTPSVQQVNPRATERGDEEDDDDQNVHYSTCCLNTHWAVLLRPYSSMRPLSYRMYIIMLNSSTPGMSLMEMAFGFTGPPSGAGGSSVSNGTITHLR